MSANISNANTQIPSKEIVLGDFIAAGGMGKVYKAKWHRNIVAVKQLLASDLSPEAQESFAKESAIIESLRHPNVVQFFGVCTDSTPFQMVMEYMPRGSLYSVLKSKHDFSWLARYQIALDTATGVAFLHSKKIIHRDLKSLNILLDADFRAKLTDFGLAKIKEETSTQSLNNAGTVFWMAPELFKKGGKCTEASDIYGLGMVFWELSSGKAPWTEAPSPYVVPTWVMDGAREEIPKNTPVEFKRTIEECWAQAPEARPIAVTVVSQLADLVEPSDDNSHISGSKAEADSAAAVATGPHYDSAIASWPATTVMSGPNYQTFMSRATSSSVKVADPQPESVMGEADYRAGMELFLEGKYRDAIPHFEKAAKADYPPAYLRLYFYSNGGIAGPKNPQQCRYYSGKVAVKLDWFRREAAKGGAEGQTNLGLCYYSGLGGVDRSEAIPLYQSAADQEYAVAQYNLGVCYLNGEGVSKDPAEAFRWFQRAADQKFALAQSNLGFCYLYGIGVTKNPAQAFHWYHLAAKNGYAEAQYSLGLCYQHGWGVEKNDSQAVNWYRLAADQEHAQAQVNLGNCYKKRVGADFFVIARLYQSAADQGLAEGQANLGWCYHFGKGVEKDLNEAIRLYRLAIEQGYEGAQDLLNILLSENPRIRLKLFGKGLLKRLS